MELTQQTVRIFIDELLGSKENYIPSTNKILTICSLFDPKEEFYHIETDTIWPKNNWTKAKERIDKVKRESEEYNRNLLEIKRLQDELIEAIIKKLNCS